MNLVLVHLVLFFKQYDGKSDADSRFGLLWRLLRMCALLVGPDDLMRMIGQMPKRTAADADLPMDSVRCWPPAHPPPSRLPRAATAPNGGIWK